MSRQFDAIKNSITKLRAVIDKFELWNHEDGSEGYQSAADALASELAASIPNTKYYEDGSGRVVLKIKVHAQPTPSQE